MDADRFAAFVAVVLALMTGTAWALRAFNRFLTDPGDPHLWPLT